MSYDDNIKNINDFIKISIEFDDKLYEKVMKKHYNSRKKSNIYVETLKLRNNNNKNQRNDINYEITSIKLNVIMRRKKKNLKKKNNKKQKLCYECDQSCDEHISNITRHDKKLCYYSKHFLNIITR